MSNDTYRQTVYKRITKGASLYGQTDAVGDLATVKETGVMPCGSGDDHLLTIEEWKAVREHGPDEGDLELLPGPLNTRKNKGHKHGNDSK